MKTITKTQRWLIGACVGAALLVVMYLINDMAKATFSWNWLELGFAIGMIANTVFIARFASRTADLVFDLHREAILEFLKEISKPISGKTTVK